MLRRRDFLKLGAAGALGGMVPMIIPVSASARRPTHTHLNSDISAYIHRTANIFGYSVVVCDESNESNKENLFDYVDFRFMELPGISFRLFRIEHQGPKSCIYVITSCSYVDEFKWDWYLTKSDQLVREDTSYQEVEHLITLELMHHMAAIAGYEGRKHD